ncbi:MAG: hypothetical protein H6706_06445 [Myxococcales bacterium]|nr:hypothetical protein [Myxococcales bacterium]
MANQYTQPLTDAEQTYALVRRYSVEPPSDWADRSRYADTSGNVHLFGGGDGEFDGFRHTTIKRKHRVGWAKLERNTQHVIRVGGTGTAGTLQMVVTSAQVAHSRPIYFLPWDARGGVTEMTLPDINNNNVEEHPTVFFTTALSGCSIVVKGTQQNPTVMHCGKNGDIARDAHDFWEDFVRYIAGHGHGLNANLGAIGTHTSKRAYVTQPGVRTPEGYGTTQSTLDYQTHLNQHYHTREARGSRIAIEQVVPWGMVVGVRRGRDWTFYLQENANIIYYTERQVQEVHRRWGGLRAPRIDMVWQRDEDRPRMVSRPMVLRPIFPGGAAVNLRSHFRSLLSTDAPV